MDAKSTIKLLVRKHPYWFLGTGLFLVLLLWQMLVLAGCISINTWSSPIQVISTLAHDLTHVSFANGNQNERITLLPHIGFTLFRFTIGFSIASFLGVTLGFLLGISKTSQAVGKPIVNVLRSLPSAAIWPVCAPLLGFGIKSQMFVIIFGSVWPTLINTMAGVGSLRQEVYDSLHFMKMEFYRRWWVLFLWSLPNIVTGLEISCAIAFLLTVTVEYFWPASGGLGWYLDYYRQNGTEMNHLLAGLFVVAVLGWGSNTLVHLGRKKLIYWEGNLRDIIKQKPAKQRAAVVEIVKDKRRRDILTSDYVTGAIESGYKTEVAPNVLYEGKPYMFPDELSTAMHVDQFGKDLIQRDITISVRSGSDRKLKVVLFARSWIRESMLSQEALEKLHEHRFTIGRIVREFEGEGRCAYRHLWYRERINEKLGTIFGSGGAIHIIQRARVILLEGKPAIFIEEFVPV